MAYPFKDIEQKWQDYWRTNKTFEVLHDDAKPKYYVLDMFAYPSGAGLHMGHPMGYTGSDIITRYKRMNGFNVLHPFGWDAFGLPAEQYAVKNKRHPRETTEENVANFRRQLDMLGYSYDWSREVNTTDPSYFKWTQWIFLKIYNSYFDIKENKALPVEDLTNYFEKHGSDGAPVLHPHGAIKFSSGDWKDFTNKQKADVLNNYRLAYIADAPVNWCPELGTVLANEEVAEQEEKGFTVVRRNMRQWMLRITAYADRLLQDLDLIDWPASTKEQQRNWIGKSEGAEIDFVIHDHEEKIRVYTTRPDTIFGATYMVLAPEHPLVDFITTKQQKTAVKAYKHDAAKKSELERTDLAKTKTGVFTGAYAVNPATTEPIPIWIADYVLATYGTGAIMAVPGNDARDFEFAKTFELPILNVVRHPDTSDDNDTWDDNRTEEGVAVNSGFLDGLPTAEAKKKAIEWIEEKGIGKGATKYRFRDWLFSRQRYWGEPFPIIYINEGDGEFPKALPETMLPVTLPDVESYSPSGTGESPLVGIPEWLNTTDLETGLQAKRETNTMPQWAGSSWYYLRYADPHNDAEPISKAADAYWNPVDLYIGGNEHAVTHLLYSRFWHKVLYDYEVVANPEPFKKLFHQGMLLGENGAKMSKSLGNVVNPDDVIGEYGTDTLRMYLMFLGPLEMGGPWNAKGINGVHRFLNRVWNLVENFDYESYKEYAHLTPLIQTQRLLNRTIRKVSEDIDNLRFNTAISALMILLNELSNKSNDPKTSNFEPLHISTLEVLLKLLAPFAPHISEELWSKLGYTETIFDQSFPQFNPDPLYQEVVIEIPVQVNGIKRDLLTGIVQGTDEEFLGRVAQQLPGVARHIEGKEIVKVIVKKDKIVNIVVK